MLNQKQILREKITKLKQSLPEKTVTDLSGIIADRLKQTDFFQEAKCIALYYAIDNEVRISEFINEWSEKKRIFLPVIDGVNLYFYPFTGSMNLHKGTYGIPEPTDATSKMRICTSELQTAPSEIDLFIVPGIAFDLTCNRLGRGKGYYDRFLTGINKPIIGLGYDFQLVDHISAEIHDIKMTMIITEKNIVIRHS